MPCGAVVLQLCEQEQKGETIEEKRREEKRREEKRRREELYHTAHVEQNDAVLIT
jgi:hypothetical protein